MIADYIHLGLAYTPQRQASYRSAAMECCAYVMKTRRSKHFMGRTEMRSL